MVPIRAVLVQEGDGVQAVGTTATAESRLATPDGVADRRSTQLAKMRLTQCPGEPPSSGRLAQKVWRMISVVLDPTPATHPLLRRGSTQRPVRAFRISELCVPIVAALGCQVQEVVDR